ncbi:MAG: SDR family mycofactocin-dependent oxidoreductase [Candidatus Aldehydirespiratoraceae bacterium]|jgi:SDR family mycofactocin-dependent oxidoreductase
MGAATVARLVEDGWSVVATDVCADEPAIPYALGTQAELEAVAVAGGDHVTAVVADVRDQAAMRAAVATAVDLYGRLDAAVAMAGVFAAGDRLWEVSDEEWDAVVDIDLRGVFHTARAAIPAILESPEPWRGRFVGVASTAGVVGLERMAPYVAAKHGVIGLVRSLAIDLSGTGVTANAIAPGSTRTAILEASAASYGIDIAEFATHQRPIGRLIEPEEIAAAVAYLCSPGAAGVTGVVLPVDGGMTSTI